MLTYIMPTRDRPAELARTLARLGSLDHAGEAAELVIVDNASRQRVIAPRRLTSGLPVRVVRLEENRSTAARNVGADVASGKWLVMLDDDSSPLCGRGVVAAARGASADAAAIGAEIFLPRDHSRKNAVTRESGGLPEVIVGCGALIRRDVFLSVGGYDASFDYYAEEYDLCAKLLLAGWRVRFDRRFRVLHEKSASNRDMGRILRRLVRNNAIVAMRYAPKPALRAELSGLVSRYFRIARKEHALRGYALGVAEALARVPDISRREMSQELWGRFTGLAEARARIDRAIRDAGGPTALGPVAIVYPGKNVAVITTALHERGIAIAADAGSARTLLVGTLSPGPMLDALDATQRQFPGHRVLGAWDTGPVAVAQDLADAEPRELRLRYAAAS